MTKHPIDEDQAYRTGLPLLTPGSATGAAAEGMRAAERAMGMVPNLLAAMSHQPALMQAYQRSAMLFQQDSGLSLAEQAAVLLTVSQLNSCDYCRAAHSFIASGDKNLSRESILALRDGGVPSGEPRLAALQEMTRVMLETSGRPTRAAVERFHAAGYDDRALLAIILGIAVKTMSNYVNHLFEPPLDAPFAAWAVEP